MLILFDIDATLLLTHGAGVRAMQRAGRRLYGEFELEGVEFAGRLDSLIFRDLAARNGIADVEAELPRFHDTYHEELLAGFANGDVSEALPGVLDLVGSLAGRDDLTLGVLTGNFELTGKLKIVKAGIDVKLFPVGVWAMDGPTRNDLPPVAMKRYKELRRAVIGPEKVVIIGDTPHDVACAQCHNCRSLGVATGRYAVDDLEQAGADWAVEDLSDTESVRDWLLAGAPV